MLFLAALREKESITRLRELVARTERERDEYQAQVHELNERLTNQTNAATAAAASAVAAIDRLQFWEALVDVAAEWAGETKREKRAELADELYQLALAEHARRTMQS